MTSTPPLAIIVPAYRARYLRAALDSLAQQTNQDFRVYVFDDASPEDLRAVFDASRLGGRANAAFRRFDHNLGGTSLIAHWNRCVQATRDEPWLWLFSDDDIADPHCAEQFARALQSGLLVGNVCRFDTATIDDEGDCTEVHPPHPPSETALDFIYHRLSWQRRSFAPEHIFRRASYEAAGGFVDFPFALGSDDASWTVFAADQPIVTLPGAMVYWRLSGENTSLLRGRTAVSKLLALADFSRWVQDRFSGRSPSLAGDGRSSKIHMDELARRWFDRTVWSLPASFGFWQVPAVSAELQRRSLGSRKRWIVRLSYVLLVVKLQALIRLCKRVLTSAP